MKKVLVVVDMQNDFVSGSLGTPEAQAVVPHAVRKIRDFDGEIVVTKDTHDDSYVETQEGAFLPVAHCLEGTWGHELCDALQELDQLKNAPVFCKRTFGSLELVQALAGSGEAIEEIELIGLCTDICVVSNALLIKAFLPEVRVAVDAACCAGVTPEKHRAALETMRSCQIVIRN